MIGYLVDTSALWHLLRDSGLRNAWKERIGAGALKLCEASRTEFLYSARGPTHRDELAGLLDSMCEFAAVPKRGWTWVESAQYRLTQKSQHRGAGPVDLLVCATAVHHGLTVLHVDDDFVTVARVLSELDEQDLRYAP